MSAGALPRAVPVAAGYPRSPGRVPLSSGTPELRGVSTVAPSCTTGQPRRDASHVRPSVLRPSSRITP